MGDWLNIGALLVFNGWIMRDIFINLGEVYVGYCWNMGEILLDYGWNMGGIWVEYGWNMGGIWVKYG